MSIATFSYTISQQLAEQRRELVMRRQVYGKLVSAGKLTQRDMDYRIGCIEATIKLLERQPKEEA